MALKPLTALLGAFLICGTAFAQTQPDQVDRLYQIQQRQRAEQEATQARADAAYREQIRVQEQKQAAEARRLQEERNAKEAAAAADKKRDQDYEDRLRSLDLQQREIEIEKQKARVARENDFINQELKEKAASTDVIQSQADATRNLSQGAKTLMEKTGEAEVKKESGMFSK